MNIRLIATHIGDRLKYDTTVNEIDRLGQSILQIPKEEFPNSAITSVRAQSIYNWIMSLGKSSFTNDERESRIVKFCLGLSPEAEKGEIAAFLEANGCSYSIVYRDSMNDFYSRHFHEEVNMHARRLFLQGNYFHAVFESAKAYNLKVKQKSHSKNDGEKLMMEVFSLNGVLKLNTGQTDTERNIQDGIKFLSSGLMRAIRNPTAHEPALDWHINKQDCLDMLSMISFLFRQLDKAVYFSTNSN